MIAESLLNGKVLLYPGDCIGVLTRLDACSIDACVTDPPYHLGFMGKAWDGGDIAFQPETWAEVYYVLKPGAHLLAFGGTRTFHRLACAIEDAGFEIRDTVSWIYGSGFPKSHDVSKGIDRAAGAEREIIGTKKWTPGSTFTRAGQASQEYRPDGEAYPCEINGKTYSAPATDAAREWQGWGTALKPACELIVLARKPLGEGTVAANVLRWGTGAINIDGCRVPGEFKSGWSDSGSKAGENTCMSGANYERAPKPDSTNGRWPANVIHDGSEEVTAAFPETGQAAETTRPTNSSSWKNAGTNGVYHIGHGDSGSSARFFYTAKADADDRLGSKHPTVKPLDLMQYLVRLVTPKGGTVLDPFAGTGTTGEAAWREGMRAVLIEAETEYQADIRRRLALALAGPDERVRESIKARGVPIDYGPLFAPKGAA